MLIRPVESPGTCQFLPCIVQFPVDLLKRFILRITGKNLFPKSLN